MYNAKWNWTVSGIHRVRTLLGTGVLIAVASGCQTTEPLTLVEEGRPRVSIIVAADEPHAQKAGEEIGKYIEKMTGAAIDVRQEGSESASPPQPVSIYVGHTQAAKESGVEIPSGFNPAIYADAFEEEGFTLQTKDGNIFIGGNSDGPYQGTLCAGYAFLEALGCRWYFPGEWGEIIPKHDTLTIPHLDVLSKPDFAIRRVSGGGGWQKMTTAEREEYSEWEIKSRFNKGHEAPYPMTGDGFLGCLLPATNYWTTHPEYFAMNDKGKREIGNIDHTTMLCLSNTNVLNEMAVNLRKAFSGGPKLQNASWPNGFGISPPDGTPYCFCEACLANSQNFSYPRYFGTKRMMTEEYYDVVVKLAAMFPDKWVATMAYSLRELPVQGISLLPNVTVLHAPITGCPLHPINYEFCWRQLSYGKMLEQWRHQTPHVYIYDYNPHVFFGHYLPGGRTDDIALDIAAYKEMDLKGVSAEGRKAVMQTWISYYITGKLLWDADADVDALKAEFYDDFFGPAGLHVQAWWDACEAAVRKSKLHRLEDFFLSHVYTTEFVNSIQKHVEAARNAELTDAQRERVEAFALIAENLETYAAIHDAEKRLNYAKAAELEEHVMVLQEKLNAIYGHFITPRHMQGSSHFAPGRKRKFEELANMMGGELGDMVAPLPPQMRAMRDPFNEGVIAEWYDPDFDDRDWKPLSTYFISNVEDKPLDERGIGYSGHRWYRGNFTVPVRFENKPVHFWCGGALNEAWIWVNGEYAGHHEYREEWHPYGFNVDVSEFVKPGKQNKIAIRVWNNSNLGGLYQRGFFWSPKKDIAFEDMLFY